MLKSNSIRRVRFCLTIAVIAMIITSCSNPPVQDTTEALTEPATSVQKQYSTSGVPVMKPHKIKWLVRNNLLVEELREDNAKHTVNYVKISGLKDKNVEAKINEKIVKAVTELEKLLQPETIAPFRGVRMKIYKDSKLLNSSVFGYTAFNYNHILSIQIFGSGNYGADGSMYGGENALYLNIRDSLNIDLNTGDEVALKDLFVDGYDYISAINDYVLSEIGNQNAMEEFNSEDDYMFFYNPYQLVAPFDGICENQPFMLDRFMLMVMFSPDDPRFLTSNNSVSFAIPLGYFGKNLAIDQRFYADKADLFEESKLSKEFVSWGNGVYGGSKWEEGIFENGRYSLNINNNSTDALGSEFEAYVEALRSTLKNYRAEGRDNFIDAHVSKRETGDFITFSKSWWAMISGVNDYYTEELVFNVDGEKVGLSDLFVPGYDYETIIRERYKETYMGVFNITEDALFQYYDQRQFSLSDASLGFNIPAPDVIEDQGILWISIEFDEFGIENLTIFED